ncbi:protein unc-93 homolog B1 isoform X2 [Neopelma chrysocephalum]|nr:protein unc-93 homolog B1 isoform X2 [Neopelma chrysocephalum]XP_027552175.1 protein unc-93 homolog B1 isoform X2 [Neopelma chrysocephalum]XP_027552176.1 protein unc-93 homolog B1 isoform X2 [Neopelma chrysocephalum]
MEKDPDCCQDGAKMVPGAGLGTEGTETQLDDFVGAHPDYNEEEEEQKYFRRKRLGIIKNVVAASLAGTLTYGVYLGLLQMQLILHYDETYREVKYSNIQLEDIDHKVLMGINVTPVAALLYTPILIRFFGTKWAMFLAVGIYALFVSSNYWERYYTLVPSAVAIGMVIVPLWASMGNYITRMAQKYYEYVNYKEEQEKVRAPRDACNAYIIIFQTIFYSCFHLSFVCAQMPMVFFLNNYLYQLNHTLFAVKHCGTLSHGTLPGFNKTVLQSLPRSVNLIVVESALMAAAFLAMLVVSAGREGTVPGWARAAPHLGRSAGAGAVRRRVPAHGGDRHAQHRLGEHLPAALQAHAGLSPAAPPAAVHLQRLRGALCLHRILPELRRVHPGAGEVGVSPHGLRLLCLGMLQLGPEHVAPAPANPAPGWDHHPRRTPGDALLLGAGAPAAGTSTAALQRRRTLGHGQRPQQDWNQHSPGNVVQEQGAPRLHLHHLPLVAGPGHLRCLPVVRAAHEGQAVHAAADAGGGGGDVPVDGAEAGAARGIPAAPPAAPTPQVLRVPLPGGGQLGRDRLRERRGAAGRQGEPGRGCPRGRAAQRGRGAAGIGTARPRPALSAERGHCPPWGSPNPPQWAPNPLRSGLQPPQQSSPQRPPVRSTGPQIDLQPPREAHRPPNCGTDPQADPRPCRSCPQSPKLGCSPSDRTTAPQPNPAAPPRQADSPPGQPCILLGRPTDQGHSPPC